LAERVVSLDFVGSELLAWPVIVFEQDGYATVIRKRSCLDQFYEDNQWDEVAHAFDRNMCAVSFESPEPKSAVPPRTVVVYVSDNPEPIAFARLAQAALHTNRFDGAGRDRLADVPSAPAELWDFLMGRLPEREC
jgi:hypothetical protein